MLTKPLLLALLAACGAPSNTATIESPPVEEPDKQPPDDDQMDQHFCCQAVDQKNLSGDGCQTIAPTQIDVCNKVLYCEGNWSKDDGHVKCE
jgi:hypothetical protein